MLTAIWYVNSGWREGDGGQLRLHLPGGRSHDVAPEVTLTPNLTLTLILTLTDSNSNPDPNSNPNPRWCILTLTDSNSNPDPF